MKGLTKRQQEILDYLRDQFNEKGYWPSIREVQKKFNFKSTNAVMGHLRALETKDAIARVPGHARAFKLSEASKQASGGLTHNLEAINNDEGVVSIPIYGSIAAGYPDRVESSGAIGSLQLDVETAGIRNKKKTYALKVRGESMVNAGIYEGDIVILEDSSPRNNDIVAALIDGETTLKRYIVQNGAAPYLKAENSDYPSLHPVSELIIQGVARSIVRSL